MVGEIRPNCGWQRCRPGVSTLSIQCLCTLVCFISSPQQSCRNILFGTAGTPPLWTKTLAPWPSSLSWQVGSVYSWTVSLYCGWGSIWHGKQKIHIRYTTQERLCGFKQLKNEAYTKQDTFRLICLFFYLHSVRLCCFAACFGKILKVSLHVALPLVLPKLLCVSTKEERKISARRHSTCNKTRLLILNSNHICWLMYT